MQSLNSDMGPCKALLGDLPTHFTQRQLKNIGFPPQQMVLLSNKEEQRVS